MSNERSLFYVDISGWHLNVRELLDGVFGSVGTAIAEIVLVKRLWYFSIVG